jgi:hypothetical protein
MIIILLLTFSAVDSKFAVQSEIRAREVIDPNSVEEIEV